MVGDIHSELPRGRNITKFVECHCPWDVRGEGMIILIGDLEWLETWVVFVAVLQVLDSQVFHHITGGQMMLVESVLARTYYGWA